MSATTVSHDNHHPGAHLPEKDYSTFMYVLAAVLVGLLVGAIVFAGLGGLILWGVGATWIMLALLVVMTAGG